ncbi:Xanthine and CO dehydrogenase maturation factor, XdhC/CoxF family [Aquimarina amphilecti]|uniref:Xanthine and CO dehydrogenase maturation factor, XdhC/CoxF family n=1 Tax=Aquimarina amphilecti TaxID=1038014 RepID=A0A1H7G3H7_AQUAM|nr:XdhC/CoxI family protein [Aquimarina amphilecti]SEK32729.1 Xanthine and CO dehydrogenase maturation factor, XdhC/CoxF family [Aquimarina amphilecti]
MTHEFKEIITSYKEASNQGIRAVIATVVDVDGSSYRRPGVGMLILENSKMTGAVSGGCVEKEVLRQSQSVFANNKAKIMTYNGRYRLGCEGVLFILIEPFSLSRENIKSIEEYLVSRTPFEISSYYSKKEGYSFNFGSTISFGDLDKMKFSNHFDFPKINDEDLDCFLRKMEPCFRLIIIGSEHDATQLSTIASATGWEVEIVNTPKTPKNTSDFPGSIKVWNQSPENLVIDKVDKQTAIILMTHNFAKDLLYLQSIKDTLPVYIGLLGPSRRREKLLSAFIEYFPDVTDEFMDCIYGPAGLNLGAETPQEIAISIIAEILSVVRNQKPISLQDKIGGIHGVTKQVMFDKISVDN